MRNYTVGINVNTADELADIGVKLRSFIDAVGDGTLEVQLAINPHGNEAEDSPSVIGFATDDINHKYVDSPEEEPDGYDIEEDD